MKIIRALRLRKFIRRYNTLCHLLTVCANVVLNTFVDREITTNKLSLLAMRSMNHEDVVSLLACMASTTRELQRDVALVICGME